MNTHHITLHGKLLCTRDEYRSRPYSKDLSRLLNAAFESEPYAVDKAMANIQNIKVGYNTDVDRLIINIAESVLKRIVQRGEFKTPKSQVAFYNRLKRDTILVW